jgi:hypothetical protein
MKRRLPIGIQDFVAIREENYVYVDKTARIHDLITGSGRYFFLSRPRRFGKSLLCSTLGALFEGRKELFGGITGKPPLAIDSLEWEWKKHPVIRIDLNAGNYIEGTGTLKAVAQNILSNVAANAGLTLRGEQVSDQFSNLIRDMYRAFGQKAVIIIDEYDKPLLTTLDLPEKHQEIRSFLKSFYGVLKSSDEYLQLGFLTGVTKFSQVSVFSDLNNLIDISMNPAYYDICGITQEELEQNFSDEIDMVIEQKNTDREAYLAEVKRVYNGYRFSEKPETVYNPFGILNHFNEQGKFNAYWFATATPTFLIKLIESQKIDILNLEKISLASLSFQKFNVDTMSALAVLYQSGYLTIVDYDEEFNEYTLDYPNEEVRSSFANALLEHYIQASPMDVNSLAVVLPRAFAKGDIDKVMEALPPFFAAIPYDIQIKDERYYQTIIHLIFRMLGLYCRSEVRMASGRIDSLVETKNYVCCFEFKLTGSAEDALQQIETRDYLLPWTGSGKGLFKVGVSFDYEKRNIGEWKIVAAGKGAPDFNEAVIV